MAGQGVLLKRQHSRIVHAGKKIVRLIVFAGVLEAVVPIFLIGAAALGRLVGRLFLAAMPFARRPTGLGAAVLIRFDADFIE